MIRIAIVEDNTEEMQLMKSYVDRCSKERGFLCTVDSYTDGDGIVEGIQAGYDLIILDIELPLINGMDAAEEIRKMDQDATIIFVTHNPNYAIRGYKVQALDYLLKPVQYKAFDEVMKRALAQRSSNSKKYIRVKIRSGTVKLDVSQIRYVDVLDHYLCKGFGGRAFLPVQQSLPGQSCLCGRNLGKRPDHRQREDSRQPCAQEGVP